LWNFFHKRSGARLLAATAEYPGTEVVMNIPSRHCPFRPPDWRARRCEHLVAEGRCPSRRDDRTVWLGWRFLCGLARCADELQKERVRRRHPDLATAVALHKSADAFARWVVEARLLAGESFAEIAARTALTAEAVAAYQNLFFDVVDGLAARYWVVNRVIRYPHATEAAEDDVGTLLKLFAFRGGVVVLESLVGYFREPEPVPADVALVPADRRQRVALHLRIRAALVALCAPYGDPRVEQFSLLADRLDALRPDASAPGGPAAVDLLREVGRQADDTVETDSMNQARRAG
jgi:hypothetical protein